ncbi:hypothetical protein AB0L06_41775 [Spirillospora sp. NPDC052269]
MSDLPMTVDELNGLAEKGAIAVVGAFATGLFATARAGIARLFARGGEDASAVIQLLDSDEDAVSGEEAERQEEARRMLAPAWQLRLTQLLRRDPDAQSELDDLLTELQAALAGEQATSVLNVAVRDHGTAYAALHGNVIHHESGTYREGPRE